MAVAVGADKQRSYDGDYMAEGKRAEVICMEFLRRQPQVMDLDDLRDLRPMQKADCDCSYYLMNGQVCLAEIKSDRHLGVSGNVLVEVLRINHTCDPSSAGTLGWTLRSPAQWLLYYAPAKQAVYMCRMAGLRRAFQTYSRKVRKELRFSVVPTDSIKTTVNVLMPWSECAEVFTIFDVSDLVAELDGAS